MDDEKLAERIKSLEEEVEALKRILWSVVRGFAVQCDDRELWEWWECERRARENSGQH